MLMNRPMPEIQRLLVSCGARLLVLGAALASARPASAYCEIERDTLAFSYPIASTPAVPPDATLWLVPRGRDIQVRLDGVGLEPVGDSFAERFQFRPPSPLALGEHRLDVTTIPRLASDDGLGEIALTFTVAELPPAFGDVEQLEARRIMQGDPLPEWPATCTSASLTLECEDIVGPAEDVLTFAPIGTPIAYLIDGRRILAGCEQTSINVWQAGLDLDIDYEIAAVLPTGVGPTHVVRAGAPAEAAPPAAAPPAAAGCGLAPVRALPAQRWLATGVFVMLALWRHRAHPRRAR